MDHDRLPGSFFGPPTLVDLLRHRATHQGDDTAFTFLVDGDTEHVSLSYAELDLQARAIAAWLEAHGLCGQRALLLYPPGLEFIAGFFGCLYAGVVAVPAYPPRMNRSLDRVQAIVADCEAHVALTTAATLERVQPLLEQTPDLKTLPWLATNNVPANAADDWRAPEVHGQTLAFLQYTSGSTGTPKGVMLTHSNLVHNSALIYHAFEHTRSGKGIFWLPSYHDMGLIGGILQPMYVGRPTVLMSPMAFLQRPIRWLKAISRWKGTTSGGPNFAYDLCVRKTTPEQRAKLDLSSWKVAFNGAEPVRAETIRAFTEMFKPCGFAPEAFYPCYGLAEATLIVSGGYVPALPVIRGFDSETLENGQVRVSNGQGAPARELVGAGQRLPDQKVEIIDPETLLPCGPGQVGEIWIAGPSVAQGYWERHEETDHTFNAHRRDTGEGPYLRSGDLGFFDGSELFVAGRLKDLIIINGRNHYPQDIETTAEKSHPAIRQGCGAAFVVEEDGQQRLILVHELERREQKEAERAMEAIRRDVSREHELRLAAIRLIKAGSIPKTSSGKIQRHACRNAYLNDDLVVVAQWDSPADTDAVEEAPRPAAPCDVDTLQPVDHRASPDESIAAAPLPTEADQPLRPLTLSAAHTAAQRAEAENGKLQKRQNTLEAVLEEVRRVAKERAAGLTIDSNILELGLDSLERMEIVSGLQERFGGRFPEETLMEMITCRDVVAAVETHLGWDRQNGSTGKTDDEILPENYRFDQYPEYVKLKQNLEMLNASGLGNPFFNVHQRVTNDTTQIDGRELINFSSYNYVGMSGDPKVSAAAKEAIDRYGTSVSASRLVSGEKTLHRELELAIADFIGAEDSIVYVGGHSTNETTIGHLFGPGDLILHDALAHNSIIQGCILSGARRRPFPHNDWQAVEDLLVELRRDYRRVLIAIEGVYSMDGDIPDLPRFIEVKRRHKALLMVDEAHSAGVLGAHGRGIGEHFDVLADDVDLWMGTLSKSFGSCGGYIAGCKAVVEYLKYTSPGFVYSVGISPPNAAAALAAIKLLEAEPERAGRLQQLSQLFLSLAQQRGLNTGLSKQSPVVPIILGNSLHCLKLSRALAQRGINVQPILYPAVEERAARLRFFITSKHSEEQIKYTVQAVWEELAKISPLYAVSRSSGGATSSVPLSP